MTLFPILILTVGSLFLWLVRKRYKRVLWALTSGIALLAWVVTLTLVTIVPQVTNLSVWRPIELFATQLELHLDADGWLFLYGITTIVVSVFFTEASRPGTATPGTRSIVLSYAAIAMVAVLAGNLLTVAATWALMDILTLVFLLSVQKDDKSIPRLITRVAVGGGGILLVLSAALLNAFEGGGSSLTSPLTSPLAAILLVLAALLRLGLLPPHINLQPLPYDQRGFGTLLCLLPPAVALSVLTRMLNIGIPLEAIPWLRLAGVLGVVVGGLRWAFHINIVAGRPFLVLGVSGLGVLAASVSPDVSGVPVAAAGIIMLLMGAVVSFTEVYSPVHRLWPGLAGILLAGMPGTPGGVIAESLALGALNGAPLVVVIIGVFGLTLLAAGSTRLIFQPSSSWPTGESLVRVVYSLGLALPILVGVGLGLHMTGSISLNGGVVFAVAIVLVILAFIWLRRPKRDVVRWGRLMAWLDLDPLYRVLWRGSSTLINLIRAIGNILEGEGAMLWMIVILLLFFLALGRTPG